MGLTNNLGKLSNMITSTGSAVGIGTTTPAELVEVSAPAVAGTSQQARLRITQAGSISARANLVSGVISGENPYFAIETRQSASPFSIVERLRIDGNGNVGIGTSTPFAKLSLGSPDGITSFPAYSTNDQASIGWNYWGASADLFTRYMDIVAKGAPDGTNGGSVIRFLTNSVTNGSNPVERMRITSSGYTKITNGGSLFNGPYHELISNSSNNYINVFGNTSSNPYGIYIVYPNSSPNSGSFNEFIWCVDSTNSKFIVWSNGTASNRTGTYGTISSDLRLKENIVEATSKLDDILKLRVVNFNLIDDTDKKKQIGFIAQEFKEVFPSLIYEKDTREYDENGNVTKGLEDSLGLNVGMEFAILVKAMQEQQALIQELNAKVSALENKS